jgi:hypothetical protein
MAFSRSVSTGLSLPEDVAAEARSVTNPAIASVKAALRPHLFVLISIC